MLAQINSFGHVMRMEMDAWGAAEEALNQGWLHARGNFMNNQSQVMQSCLLALQDREIALGLLKRRTVVSLGYEQPGMKDLKSIHVTLVSATRTHVPPGPLPEGG